jgi:hypothetical protein
MQARIAQFVENVRNSPDKSVVDTVWHSTYSLVMNKSYSTPEVTAQLRQIVSQYLAAGWGLKTVAVAAGVDQPALSRWYSQGGVKRLRSDAVDRLCLFFGVRLTSPRSIPEPPSRAAAQAASAEQRRGTR